MKPWGFLLLAGAFEIAWAVGLKFTDGFTRLWPSLLTFVAMLLSFFFLAHAVRSLPLGTAYAVWTGIGALGTTVFGMIYLSEPATAFRLAAIALILIGIVGLKLSQ